MATESGFSLLGIDFKFFFGAGGLDAFATLTELFAVVREVSGLLAVVVTFGAAWGRLLLWVLEAFVTC